VISFHALVHITKSSVSKSWTPQPHLSTKLKNRKAESSRSRHC